ncbi:MAG: ABC transporter permease [Gorillibacterium sp.]|nr:ABC transporter permease [Gorillibacterium sp.]
MFYLWTGILNIRRYKFKSILSVLIFGLIVLLLNLYIANIQTNRKQLSDLAKVLPVLAHISNLDGSQNVGLEIKKETVMQLQSSPYVSGLAYTTQLMAGLGDFPVDEQGKYLTIPVVAVNTINALPGLPLGNITLANGATLDFLQSNEAQCLVDEQFLKQNKLAVGDTIVLKPSYYRYEPDGFQLRLRPLGLFSIKIIGSVAPWNQMSSGIVSQIILPVGWTQVAFDGAGIEYYADSAAFTVKDALKLNAFKAQMQEFKFKSVQVTAPLSYNGNTLVVADGNFIKAASHLQENLSLLNRFFRFILVVVAFAGYITSYLLMQNRRPEFAVMRSLGSSKSACFTTLITESVILQIIGGLLSSVVAMLLGTGGVTALPVIIAMFFFMLGTIVALLFLGRFNVMAILFRND